MSNSLTLFTFVHTFAHNKESIKKVFNSLVTVRTTGFDTLDFYMTDMQLFRSNNRYYTQALISRGSKLTAETSTTLYKV